MREDPWPVPRFRPVLKYAQWEAIEPLTRELAAKVYQEAGYSPQDVLSAIARHLDWATLVVDDVTDVERVFSRPMVVASVMALPSATGTTQSRHRSILLRVSESLGLVEPRVAMPSLRNSTAAAPYSEREQAQFRTWVSLQPNERKRRSLQAMLALGFGAGLLTYSLARVRACDIGVGGRTVRVVEKAPRIVPVVKHTWSQMLAEVASQATDPDERLFHPRWKLHPNIVKRVVATAQGDVQVLPTRMRATWIVERLVEGTPMPDLMTAAGVTSLDAFKRFQVYFPEVNARAFESSRHGR